MSRPPRSGISAALPERLIPCRIELTNAGDALLEDARWILARAEQAIRNVERAGRGEFGKLCVGFTFAASFDAFVPATIRTFQQTYPGVSLQLREADSLAFCRGLLEGEVDAPFIRPLASHDERIQFDEPFILYPRRLAPTIHDATIASCRKAGFTPTLVPEAPQVSSTINLVAAGIGISILPASMQQIHTQGAPGDSPDIPELARLVNQNY